MSKLLNIDIPDPAAMEYFSLRNVTGTEMVSIFFLSITNKITLYNILFYCQRSTCLGRFFRPSSGAQELYTQHLVCARLACCYR